MAQVLWSELSFVDELLWSTSSTVPLREVVYCISWLLNFQLVVLQITFKLWIQQNFPPRPRFWTCFATAFPLGLIIEFWLTKKLGLLFSFLLHESSNSLMWSRISRPLLLSHSVFIGMASFSLQSQACLWWILFSLPCQNLRISKGKDKKPKFEFLAAFSSIGLLVF